MILIVAREKSVRSRPFFVMLGASLTFFSVGLLQLFAAGRAWLGALILALSLFWLIVSWYYGGQTGAS
jgi:hypothetical protein